MARVLTEGPGSTAPPVHIAGPPEPTSTGPTQRCLRCDAALPPPKNSGRFWEIGTSVVVLDGVRGAALRARETKRTKPACEPVPDELNERLLLDG